MTFHGLGYLLLSEHGKRLGLQPPLRVATPYERLNLLEDAAGLSEEHARRVLTEISRLKRQGGQPDANSDLLRYLHAYNAAMRALFLVDYDDLVTLTVELLAQCADLKQRCRELYRWISVDEFQDVDDRQYALVRLLAPPDGNICAIGDPDQAIYSFRGSDTRFFQQFPRDFPSARVIQLRRNYRSTATILAAALEIVAPVSLVEDRQLEASMPGSEKITVHESPTDRAEAEFVVHTIEQMLGGATFFSFDSRRVAGGEDEETSRSFGDFAVLYRTSEQAATLQEAFMRSGLPFQCRSHASLADSSWVRTLVRELQGMPDNESVVGRVERSLARLKLPEIEDEHSALAALRALARRTHNIAQFLSELAMGIDADLWDPRGDRVSLLTLHASKGLEFPVVFIVGCEDGVLPLQWGTKKENLEEERRLFFVGMTRCRERLFLTYARRRHWRGSVRTMRPSPFLTELREALLTRSRAPGGVHKAAPKHEQLNLF